MNCHPFLWRFWNPIFIFESSLLKRFGGQALFSRPQLAFNCWQKLTNILTKIKKERVSFKLDIYINQSNMKGRKGSMESSRCKICLLSRIETGRCDRWRLRLQMAFSNTKQALFLKTFSTLFLFLLSFGNWQTLPSNISGWRQPCHFNFDQPSSRNQSFPTPSKTSLQAF